MIKIGKTAQSRKRKRKKGKKKTANVHSVPDSTGGMFHE
jgi:hypothetical protein